MPTLHGLSPSSHRESTYHQEIHFSPQPQCLPHAPSLSLDVMTWFQAAPDDSPASWRALVRPPAEDFFDDSSSPGQVIQLLVPWVYIHATGYFYCQHQRPPLYFWYTRFLTFDDLNFDIFHAYFSRIFLIIFDKPLYHQPRINIIEIILRCGFGFNAWLLIQKFPHSISPDSIWFFSHIKYFKPGPRLILSLSPKACVSKLPAIAGE